MTTSNAETTPPPIRLGLIGTGLAAHKLHWPALAQLTDRFTVVGLANRTREAAAEFAAFAGLSMDGFTTDYHDLLRRDDIDAVLVAVPIGSLLAVATDAITAGKHLLCEKPPGADADEGQRFVDLVDRHPGQVVLMGEQVFYRDVARLARQLIDDGAIGQPQLLQQRWVRDLVPTPGEFSSTPWRYRSLAYPGGPLLDGGVHGIATIRLLGGDMTGIGARTAWINATMEAPSALTMNFALSSGAIGDCFWGFPGHPAPQPVHETQVIGDTGGLVLDMNQVVVTSQDGTTITYLVDSPDGGFFNQWLNFADAVQHQEPVIGTVRQSFANMQAVLEALSAAAAGRPSDTPVPGSLTGGVPLWRPRGTAGLFDGLPVQIRQAGG